MENQDMVVVEEPDIFHILDSKDEQQIVKSMQDQMNQALIYEVTQWNPHLKTNVTRYELTYSGVNYLTMLMSQKLKQGLKLSYGPIFENHTIKDPESGADIPFVSCTLKILNEHTGFETPGEAEQAIYQKMPVFGADKKRVYDEGKKEWAYKLKYDDFARRKALSKAMRNAWKLQFPPKLIMDMIAAAKVEGKKEVVDATEWKICKCPKEAQIKTESGKCMNCGGKLPT